MGFDTMRDCVM